MQLALFLLVPLLPVTEKYLLGLLGLSSGMFITLLLFLASFFLMDTLANMVVTKHLSDHTGKLVKFICKTMKSRKVIIYLETP